MGGGGTHISLFIGARTRSPYFDITHFMEILRDVLLAPLTTFRVGGPASHFLRATTNAELLKGVRYAQERNLTLFVLGGGSNVLFKDEGFSGLVLTVALRGVSISREGNDVLVTAAAGEPWDELVQHTVENNFYGLENLSGIPGLVGATPIQNVGAYGTEVKEKLKWVEVFDTHTDSIKRFRPSECHFGYRDSIFKKEAGKHYIVTNVCFRLSTAKRLNTSYKDITAYFDTHNVTPTLQSVRDAVLAVRSRKFPDLNRFGTAGSFFKNPMLTHAQAKELKAVYKDVPTFEQETGVKIPLAWILDTVCNLKGFNAKSVGLFEKQPLVVVNFGGALQKDIISFTQDVAAQVYEKTGIHIEPEVTILS